MMKYALKSATTDRTPYTNQDGVYGIDVVIRTKIVDQPYEGFENLNVGFCPIEKTDTINQAEQKINTYAEQFVKTNYPDVV